MTYIPGRREIYRNRWKKRSQMLHDFLSGLINMRRDHKMEKLNLCLR